MQRGASSHSLSDIRVNSVILMSEYDKQQQLLHTATNILDQIVAHWKKWMIIPVIFMIGCIYLSIPLWLDHVYFPFIIGFTAFGWVIYCRKRCIRDVDVLYYYARGVFRSE